MSAEPPLCPGCGANDRLEHHPRVARAKWDIEDVPVEDLYFCLRCQSWTTAIPINARVVQEPAPVPEEPAPAEKPKRGRKRKEASGE